MPKLVRPNLEPIVEAAIDTLGNRVRVSILGFLLANGPATRSQIAAELGINVKTLQFHLTALRADGAVRVSPASEAEQDTSGRLIVYDCDAARVRLLLRGLADHLGMADLIRDHE